MASIHIAGDLERIGDLAKNIAKRASRWRTIRASRAPWSASSTWRDLAAMQLKDVLDAYAQRDAERAKAVWRATPNSTRWKIRCSAIS